MGFETLKQEKVDELDKETLSKEVEELKLREQELLEQLEKVRGAITLKEHKASLREGEEKLVEKEIKEKEKLEKIKAAIEKGRGKL